MTESNQGPATPGTDEVCPKCTRIALRLANQANAAEKEAERLKAENASLLESLRAAREDAERWQNSAESAGPAVTEANELENAAEAKAAAAEQRAEAAEKALTELLRLYDWRFELAEREKDPRNRDLVFHGGTLRLLRQYGAEKKAAWEAARAALHDEERQGESYSGIDRASVGRFTIPNGPVAADLEQMLRDTAPAAYCHTCGRALHAEEVRCDDCWDDQSHNDAAAAIAATNAAPCLCHQGISPDTCPHHGPLLRAGGG